jgi:hypothetical protein
MRRPGLVPPALSRLTAALLAIILPWSDTRGDPPALTGRVPYDGSQIFRRYILHDLCKLRAAQSSNDVFNDPRNSLVILLGDTRAAGQVGITSTWLGELWMRQGAVLIASDRGADRLLDEELRITGPVVSQPALEAYRQQQECPLIKHYVDPLHPIFRGLTRGLATNKPSFLTGRSPPLPVLARFPRECFLKPWEAAEPLAYIAGSGHTAGPENRVLVIAGNGLFINGMLAQRDSDNFAFACNCIRWLTSDGQRKQVLFVEEGKIQASFDVPIRELPPLPIPPSQVVEKILGRLEEEGFFDRLFGSDTFWRGTVLLLSAALLVYGVSRLLGARHRREINLPLLPEGLAPAAPLSPMTQRHRDLVRAGNLWEAARALARSCFDQLGEPWQAHPPPSLEIAGGWVHRLRLRRQVQQLWSLAHGEAGPVSPRRYAQIAARALGIQAALADGSLRFTRPSVDPLE